MNNEEETIISFTYEEWGSLKKYYRGMKSGESLKKILLNKVKTRKERKDKIKKLEEVEVHFQIRGNPWIITQQLTHLFFEWLVQEGWDIKADWDFENKTVNCKILKKKGLESGGEKLEG